MAVTWWLGVPLVLVGLVIADRLLLAAERRRWIFYRTTSPSRSTVGNALQSIERIYAPEKQHVVEHRAAIDADQDEDGEPPGV